jgi:radical SAM protein with 4Fe4S-binding SPASM domain
LRVGGNIDRVYGALDKISRLRRGEPLSVVGNFIVGTHNEGELADLDLLLNEYPALDKIQVHYLFLPQWNKPREHARLFEEFIPDERNSRYRARQLLVPSKACGDYKRAFVSWEGHLKRCWNDTQTTDHLGNVFEDGFFNIWGGGDARGVKQQVKAKGLDICKGCPQTTSYMSRSVKRGDI